MFLGKVGCVAKNKKSVYLLLLWTLFSDRTVSKCLLPCNMQNQLRFSHLLHSGSGFWYQQPGIEVPGLF